VRAQASGEKLLQQVLDKLTPLEAILASKEGTGTVAERVKLDDAYAAQEEVASAIGALQELMVPADYIVKLEANIPSDFDKLPRLLGRATVVFTLEKPTKGDKFNVEGTLYDQAVLVSGQTYKTTGTASTKLCVCCAERASRRLPVYLVTLSWRENLGVGLSGVHECLNAG
jgi:hypothetical protein